MVFFPHPYFSLTLINVRFTHHSFGVLLKQIFFRYDGENQIIYYSNIFENHFLDGILIQKQKFINLTSF